MHVKMYVQTNTETFILHDDNDKMMKKKQEVIFPIKQTYRKNYTFLMDQRKDSKIISFLKTMGHNGNVGLLVSSRASNCSNER